jgi:hypothetical protein
LSTNLPLALTIYSPTIGEQLLDQDRGNQEVEPVEAVAGPSREMATHPTEEVGSLQNEGVAEEEDEMNAPYDPGWELWHDSVMRALAAVSAKEDPASSTCPPLCQESLRVCGTPRWPETAVILSHVVNQSCCDAETLMTFDALPMLPKAPSSSQCKNMDGEMPMLFCSL